MRSLWHWFTTLISLQPHFKIGREGDWYMLRWFIVPRNPWLNVYLHKFLRDDDDRALHDHPWWFVSLMLSGRYTETRAVPRGKCKFFGWPCDCLRESTNTRHALSIAFRRAEDRHRVTLDKDENGNAIPCWTLVITGPRVRTWGFWCPKGFVPWQEFVAPGDGGQIGKGCGD